MIKSRNRVLARSLKINVCFLFQFCDNNNSIIQANMANASLTFHKILFLSFLLCLTLQQCPANTKLPQLYKNEINLSMMRADRPSSQIGARRTLYYASNYPIELITRSSSANIDSVLSIQRLETGNLQNGLNYKVKQIRSQTSLLITVQYSDLEWKDLFITVLLFSKSSYPRLSFGQLSLINAESRLTLSSTAKLNIAGVMTGQGFKSILFIVGLKVSVNQQTNYDVEVLVTDRIDEANKQYIVNVNAGSNTILSEIYLNYIVFLQGPQYQIEGVYYSFSDVISGQHLRYLGQSISSGNYFFSGISSIKFKQGNAAFSYKIQQKSSYQNTLSLTTKNPFSILKIALFRVSVPISQACASCGSQNVLMAFTDKSATCVSACTQGLATNSKCLACPTDINYGFSQTDGKCSCTNGLTGVNGQCLSQAAAKKVAISSATFSISDSDCTDSNAAKAPDGTCKCKFGYQKKQIFNNYQCAPICQPLQYYNGQSCISCQLGTFPWPDLQTCLPCSDQCKTCGSYFTCQQCYPGFQQNINNQCVQICGDGIRISSQCDDGNVNNGDGCSSQCKVEGGWKCEGVMGGRSVCSNQDYKCIRKGSSLMSGNLIVEYQVDPQPPKIYSPSQLQQIFRVKFTQSPPYQNYLVQNPANPSIFRLVATYGGNAPILPAIIQVQFTLPNNQIFKDTVQQNFIMSNGRNFALRGGSNDVLK